MKYMLMMIGPKSGWSEFNTLKPAEIRAHIEFMKDVNKQLTERGEWVDGQGLAFPDQAKIVRAQPGGAPAITDGPFPEAKEFLAGYWIVDCESLERVLEIAAHISTAPGRDGVPLNIPVEVREVMSGPPEV